MRRTTPAPEVRCLVDLVDEAFNRRSWHGTSLRGSLRGLSESDVTWRPGAGRHNTREIALHAAYWKYAAWRRLTGGTRGRFPLPGSNWFPVPKGTKRAWRDDLALLDEMHAQLREAVTLLDPAALDRPAKGAFTTAALVRGIAAHDLYHAGQVQLLKRLRRS
jgi:uncharacterized damage-inducible protein DinB